MAEVTTCSSFINVSSQPISRTMSPNNLSNSSRNQSTPEMAEADSDVGATDLTVQITVPSSSPSHALAPAPPAPAALTIPPSITMTPIDEEDEHDRGDEGDDEDDGEEDVLEDVIPNGLNIRFKSHSSALSAALLSLLSESYGTDVHLKCDHLHDTIRAHRIVLAAFSPLFKSLLKEIPSGSTFPVIMLPSIQHDTLETIINFCYKGKDFFNFLHILFIFFGPPLSFIIIEMF